VSLSETAGKRKTMLKLFTAKNSVLDCAAFFQVYDLFVGMDSGAVCFGCRRRDEAYSCVLVVIRIHFK
jgi:hypothetical protein